MRAGSIASGICSATRTAVSPKAMRNIVLTEAWMCRKPTLLWKLELPLKAVATIWATSAMIPASANPDATEQHASATTVRRRLPRSAMT